MKENAVSFHIEIKEEIPNLFLRAEVFFQSPENGQYNFELINRTIDACKFFSNKLYEPLFQVAYRMVQQYGDVPNSCPIKMVCAHVTTKYLID